jgi:hypothetical protein
MGLVSLTGSGGPADRDPTEAAYAERVQRWRRAEQAYVSIQGTKPQTLAAGLTDSPAGLAAWVGEKWWAWSDQDDTGEPLVPREDLLTALSLYWFTGTIGSASRLYYESARDPVRLAQGQRVEVPCGFLLERSGDDRRPDTQDTGFAAVPRIGAPGAGRACLRRRALDGGAGRRALPRLGDAGAVRRRGAGVLPAPAVSTRPGGVGRPAEQRRERLSGGY